MTVPIIGTTKKQFVCKNTHKTRIVSELVDSYQLLLVERKTGMQGNAEGQENESEGKFPHEQANRLPHIKETHSYIQENQH